MFSLAVGHCYSLPFEISLRLHNVSMLHQRTDMLRSETVNSLDHTVLCKGKSLLSLYFFFETLSLQTAEKENINITSALCADYNIILCNVFYNQRRTTTNNIFFN